MLCILSISSPALLQSGRSRSMPSRLCGQRLRGPVSAPLLRSSVQVVSKPPETVYVREK